MKYLIVFVVIFVIACSYVNAECSDEDAKVIKDCYTAFNKATNIGNSHHVAALKIGDDKKFCAIFHEHQKCLQNGPKCFFDTNVKEIEKILDANTTEISKMLLMEYSFKYVCSHKYTGSPEDSKCFATITTADIEKECEKPKGCKDFKEFPVCFKKVLVNKCKNEEVSTIYADAMGYALKNLLTKC